MAYDRKYDNDPVMAYGLAIFAAIISITGWVYVIRHFKEPNTIMVVNIIWDVGGTIVLHLIPLFLFDFKIDTKTIVGCIISIVGIIIAKS